MSQATIGSLNVILGMDAGEFDAAVAKVHGSLGKLATKFGFVAGVAAEFGRALVRGLGNALGSIFTSITSGFGNAVNAIGDMVDMSQRLGIPVEQLQGMAHAADLSGTSIENVGKAMEKLAANMTAIAGGETGGKAALTLQTLGISATDAAGQLKATDAVMIELADKFAGMEDGAAKTAAAMAVFGKSGAELIPMLNMGGEELRRAREEADKLGMVLDGNVASGLEALGDEWSTLGKAAQGFWQQLSGQLLPVFKLFTDKIKEWIDSGGGVKGWAQTVGDGLKTVTEWALRTAAAFSRLRENLVAAGSAFGNFFSGDWGRIAADNEAAAQRILEINQKLKTDIDKIWSDPAAGGAATPGSTPPAKPAFSIPDSTAAAEAKRAETEAQKLHNTELQRFNELRAEGKRIYEETLSPLEQLAAAQERMNEVNRKGGLLAHEYAAAQQRATMLSLNAYAGMASGIAGNLAKLFGESKAFAIAQAVINTAEAVTKTLATYGATPWGLAAAAAAAAAGAAQIAAIRSANKGGGGGGSSDVTASSASGAATAPQQQQSVFINLNGEKFGREQVLGLIDGINDAVRDGARIMVNAT